MWLNEEALTLYLQSLPSLRTQRNTLNILTCCALFSRRTCFCSACSLSFPHSLAISLSFFLSFPVSWSLSFLLPLSFSLSMSELYNMHKRSLFQSSTPRLFFFFIEKGKWDSVLSSGKNNLNGDPQSHVRIHTHWKNQGNNFARKQKEGKIQVNWIANKNTLRPKWLSALLKTCKWFVAAPVDDAAEQRIQTAAMDLNWSVGSHLENLTFYVFVFTGTIPEDIVEDIKGRLIDFCHISFFRFLQLPCTRGTAVIPTYFKIFVYVAAVTTHHDQIIN